MIRASSGVYRSVMRLDEQSQEAGLAALRLAEQHEVRVGVEVEVHRTQILLATPTDTPRAGSPARLS